MRILSSEFILYVADQTRSTAFYTTLLGNAPTLDVPGMTEFSLSDGCKLGLMPESGIARIISGPLRHPSEGNGIPRCELYLLVDDLAGAVQRAMNAGAQLVDQAADRDWGHRVAYCADPDGHVIALAAPCSLASSRSIQLRQDAGGHEGASSRSDQLREDAGGNEGEHDLFYDPNAETTITARNLPHWKQEGKLYFVTWRQMDSLSQTQLDELRALRETWLKEDQRALNDLAAHARHQRAVREHVERWLDAGYGSCVLKQPGPRDIMSGALRFFAGKRYELGSFAIAGNHVHVLVSPLPGTALSSILHSWKSFTGTAINRHLGNKGSLWRDESYDHLVRNEAELERIEDYILRHSEQGAYVQRRHLDM